MSITVRVATNTVDDYPKADRFALDEANTGHLFILDAAGNELAVYAPEGWISAVVADGESG